MRNPIRRPHDNAGAADNRAACVVTMTPEQAEHKGMAWVIGAFLICPCHLPLTLGLAATLLSGTAAGVLLRDHPYVAGAVVTTMWLAGTWRGIHHFRSARTYAEAAMQLKPVGRQR